MPSFRVPLLAFFGGLLVLAGCAPGKPKLPRGIVVVLIDTLRADHVGLYGSKWPATPEIDRLGPESVWFERAFSQASWTRPSVPSLFTGLYPSEHGMTGFDQQSETVVVRGQVLAEEATTLAEGMKAAGYRTALAGFQYQLSTKFNQQQGFDFYKNNISGGGGKIVSTFLEWVDEAPEKPFFAYLHFLDIHWPYCPPKRVHWRFDPPPSAMNVCGNAKALRAGLADGSIVATEADRRALDARYSEKLLSLDDRMGDLFRELRKRGLWDDTLLVVTADHGQEFGEHGGFDHGTSLFDELLHVPFIFKLPARFGGRSGSSLPPIVEIRSLLPTLFDLVGQPIPAAVSAPSLLPWLSGRAPAEPPVTFVAAESNGFYAVRDERYKLVVQPATGRQQLYDLVEDPLELSDIAASHPAELARMQSSFRRWRANIKPLPTATTALDQDTAEGLRSLGYLQ
jgi:choline-sulfatase